MIEVRDCIYDEKGNYLEYYDLYAAHGNFVDRIWNMIMFLDVSVQIREKQKVGFYLLDKNGYRIDIDSDGNYDWNWLDNPFNENELFTRLLQRQKNGIRR